MRSGVRYLRGGKLVSIDPVDPSRTLLEHLRLDCRAVGTKEGCNEGDCGACTVVLARVRNGVLVHEPVNSCILLMGQVDGAEVITVEDLASDGRLHPVQQAMVAHHASQCGFCTPGIVMSLFALYQDGARPVARGVVADQLAGNLCRCTGYRPIFDAARAVLAEGAQDGFARAAEERSAALAALEGGGDLFSGTPERFFAAPASVDALAQLFSEHPDAVLVGGATDVGLWVTKRLKDLPKVIWLGRVAGFAEVARADGGLHLGAGVPLARAAGELAALDPDLGEVMRRFGSAQVRASGTVGGNIANGSPIGDLAPCLIALGASVSLRRGEAVRTLPLEAFFIAYGKQDRAASEFVLSLAIPDLPASRQFRAFKVSKRFDEDISAVLGAFAVDLEDGRVTGARIAFGGMAPTPRRAGGAERALIGADLADPATWEAAIDALGTDYQPIDDMRASAAYRLSTARALLEKALFEISSAPTTMTRILGHRETGSGEVQA